MTAAPPAVQDWPASADAALVAAGRHPDPFAILGPHDRGGQRRVTAFDPGAERLWALSGEAVHPLHPVGGAPGVFSGPVAPGPYRIRGEGPGGRRWEHDDPFRFGPVIGEVDEYLLAEGTHLRLWQVLGAHVMRHEGVSGTHFAVWAPNARRVSVVGPFNGWDGRRHPMRSRGSTGVWEIFLPGIGEGAPYKYEILGPDGAVQPLKADPVGFGAEHPPATASVVRDIAGYGWKDAAWMSSRAARNDPTAPVAIYEVHVASWRRIREEGGRPLSWREAAEEIVAYAAALGFTHLELMPVSEHPFDGSWGYQPVGLFAPTIRFGPPHEFRDLVDAAHRAGLGVILDWVPGHFPADAHGLARFDGTHLYEHEDPREGFHPDWNTLIYNYGRREVANFLVANALYWLEEYHVDGLRVDAVASMLYRDYSRPPGGWVRNVHGGRENIEAIAFLRHTNQLVGEQCPQAITIAEESTAFPAARPSGLPIQVTYATVATPAARPSPTMVRASSTDCPRSRMKAPEPVFTSSTSAGVPSAIFLLMIEDAISGIDSTVPVTSRSAYSFLSAGARPGPGEQITAPTSSSSRSRSAGARSARQPGIASSLSRVPPVWPNPRPDNCGTAAPQAATIGASGSVIMSPTPPVECLSTTGRRSAAKSIRSPVAIIAAVQVLSSAASRPRKTIAMASAAICSSPTSPAV